jgi:hypothetical protein
MNKNLRALLVFLLIIALLPACTLSKRQHQPGFYFSWNKKVHSENQSYLESEYSPTYSDKIPDTLIQLDYSVTELSQEPRLILKTVKHELTKRFDTKDTLLPEPVDFSEKAMLKRAEELDKFNKLTKRRYLPSSLVLAFVSSLSAIIAVVSLWGVNPTLYAAVLCCFISLLSTIFSLDTLFRMSQYKRKRRAFLKDYKSYESNVQYQKIRRSIIPNVITSFFMSISFILSALLTLLFGILMLTI